MPEVPSCWRPPGQRSPIAPPGARRCLSFGSGAFPLGSAFLAHALCSLLRRSQSDSRCLALRGDSGTPWSRVPRAPRPARLGGRELGRRGRVGPGAEASPRPAPLAAGPGGRKGPKRGPTPRLPEPIAGSAERK